MTINNGKDKLEMSKTLNNISCNSATISNACIDELSIGSYANKAYAVKSSVNVNYNGIITIDRDYFFKKYKVPGDFIYLDKEGNLKQVAIKEVIFSNPATIILWDDGTRTVCKTYGEDIYNPESGLVICIIKKLYGGSNLKKVMETWIPSQQHFKGTASRVTMKDARNNMKK